MAALKIVDSLQTGFDAFFAFLPNLLAFLVILVVGYVIAKIVAGVVRKALQKVGLDKALHESDAKQYVDRVIARCEPSAAIGKVVLLHHLHVRADGCDRGSEDPGRHRVHEPGARLPAKRDRGDRDLRGGGRPRRRRRRRRGQAAGRHAHRQDRRNRGSRAGDADRRLHGAQPAQDRAGDRADHLHGSARHGRVSPRRSRSGSAAARWPARCSATPTARARSSGPGQATTCETGKERGQEQAERGKQRAQAEVGTDRQRGNGGQGGAAGSYRAEG